MRITGKKAPVATSRVVVKHHALVRLAHWATLPLLLGLIASGLSIYWASPVHEHAPDPNTGSTDYLADVGVWIAHQVPGNVADPAAWVYDRFGLGTFLLAQALRLHWLFAYLFMAVGLLYVIGLALGGGYKALLPRRSDPADALAMLRYYLGVLPAKLLRRPWPHPPVTSKYNALQRIAYMAVPLLGLVAVASGWAMHKPVQLKWLERLFVNYEGARVIHFWTMVAFAIFVIPHVILVIADGWDTLRSMVTGWSFRAPRIHRRVSLAERLAEPEESSVERPVSKVRARTRRDFLYLSTGALVAAGGFWWFLPDETRQRHLTPALRDWLDSLEARLGADRARREKFLNRVLTFDDDVAEALYSPTRSVRAYSKSQITALKNNYNGATPKPDYLPGWTLTVSGLASGRVERFTIADLLGRFARHEQVTRLCCVEGWSAIAWWGGLRFADLLQAHSPAPGARWAKLESSVNLDAAGNSDPYYVSIDLPTARHPQTLLATHLSGETLPVEHGAPLRLLAPMKLGLKNIKAITSISYSVEEPADYWHERGYSGYDGL
jgi:DMSO/TMAO reductase YedYZ molybdopterin-dependent catalytic subunit/thiosulfate reductase cytochrome b subunit